LEKRTLLGRYSNSLVIDAGSQFSLRAYSQASVTGKFFNKKVRSKLEQIFYFQFSKEVYGTSMVLTNTRAAK
jgi:hypothetical protein